MSWTRYKPFNNGGYNTIWELARQLVDEYRQEYPLDNRDDDTLIQEYGIPYLCRWVFTTDGVNPLIDLTRPEWNEFMKLFFLQFLNMEIYTTDPRIWKRSISMAMLLYQEFIEETAQPLYEALKDANAVVTNTRNGNDTGTTVENIANTVNDNTKTTSTDVSTGATERTGETKNNTQTDSTQTNTGESFTESTGNTKASADNTSTNASRVLHSDTPQSIVNASTVGNPDLQTWTYASAMQDNNEKQSAVNTSTGEEKNASKSNDTSNGTTSSTAAQTGNTSDTESRKDNYEHTNESAHTKTLSGKNDSTNHSTSSSTYVNETMSAFELTKEKYEIFKREIKKPIYKVLETCYKYFISTYPEEERWGFLDWSAIDKITSKVKEVDA